MRIAIISRKCPGCGDGIEYYSKDSFRKAADRNSKCSSCAKKRQRLIKCTIPK